MTTGTNQSPSSRGRSISCSFFFPVFSLTDANEAELEKCQENESENRLLASIINSFSSHLCADGYFTGMICAGSEALAISNPT